MARSLTNSTGFSTNSVMIPSPSSFTTPKARGSSTLFTQITPSHVVSSFMSARNSVSAKAMITRPFRAGAAHRMAWAVPNASA